MNAGNVSAVFEKDPGIGRILSMATGSPQQIHIKGLAGSSLAFAMAGIRQGGKASHCIVARDKDEAAYLYNDLQTLLGEGKVVFFPESFRRAYDVEEIDNSNVLLRTEALNHISRERAEIVVTYPEAIAEKVVTKEEIKGKTQSLKVGESVDIDFVIDFLIEYGFYREDFVYEPGQFAARGGIIDVFSFSNDLPFRVEFEGDQVSSIRSFDPDTQLSVSKYDHIELIPNIEQKETRETRQNLVEFMKKDTWLWLEDPAQITEKLRKMMDKAQESFANLSGEIKHASPEDLYVSEKEWYRVVHDHTSLVYNEQTAGEVQVTFQCQGQPPFQKNFDKLLENLVELKKKEYQVYIFSDQPRQFERLHEIFDDLLQKKTQPAGTGDIFVPVMPSIHEGFINHTQKIACFTDHQIFERYKRYKLKAQYSSDQAITLKELTSLQPGDYVTHINHGIGQFAGLEKIDNNGKVQEAVKLLYKDGDVIYVSIQSLHRISKYSSKDGKTPTVHKIGGTAWQATKAKTKKKVKELAFDLIQLYAKRRSEQGFAFHPDTYLQHELEASFIYEDTPDQNKATRDVKTDMEKVYPMDRLVCGDVGFGKTEVAIRAAFKAATDGKQVAVLVPTTILALQHFKTFSARLRNFPVTVDYLNRFKSSASKKETLKKLEEGKIDILIGTHAIVGKDVKFKDLGLLIIDEEQKFGVGVKDKLKTLKANVDTLTLTATPIPRTLQFSLLGARDMSVIRTPPPNRYPVVTELRGFHEELIRDAIMNEVGRNGQVFFIHNRVQNIMEVTGMIQRLCPGVTARFAHGQMDGKELEEIMVGFIDGDFDVLVSTSIVESGLDIPNANTIIINEAQNFGLSDLHQMRGRVGRSNKKAYCYLLTPPFHTLTQEARKRLKALVEFSDLGSGIHIAMKDLDIRGAGDLLGAEQSGFINEVGYETYQKILNEALKELKENEFREVFKEELEKEGREWVDDCTIDSDLELLIPELYVDNISERLILYKELDGLTSEEEMEAFAGRLRDRFGPLPQPVIELLDAVRLRKIAQQMGFDKIVMKQGIMIAHFLNNPSSAFYESPLFLDMVKNIQSYGKAELKQKHEKLTVTFRNITSVKQALDILAGLKPKEEIFLSH